MQDKKTYLRIIVNFVIMIVIFILALIWIPKLLSFFLPFFIALLLSFLANPVVSFMEQRIRIKRKHGSAIIIIIVIAALIGAIYVLGVILLKEAMHLIEDIPNIAKTLTELMNRLRQEFGNAMNGASTGIQDLMDRFIGNIEQWFTKIIEGTNGLTLAQAGDYVKNIGNAFFLGIITVIATYFFIANRDIFEERIKKILPKTVLKGLNLITYNCKVAILGYLKAQVKIMIILIILMFFVFVCFDIKYALFLAILIGAIDLLPVLGTGLIFWPWSFIDFLNQNYVRAITILGLYLVCQILKQILQPKLVGDSVHMNPFAAILFMFIGYRLKGLVGMILGIPFGMAIINFYRIGMFDRIIRGFQIITHDINEFRKF